MFLLTSMPVGGAETLLANLMGSMNAARFVPEICCLKELGPLGEQLSERFTCTSKLLHHKYDLCVVPRLVARLRGIDALVTVGAGDKMFWGRIAARIARTPLVLSALHSTGWPDGLGRLNRMLTPWTDGFIAVAREHGRFLVQHEGLPAEKVHVIPNGVDTQRFNFDASAPFVIRQELGIPTDAPLCGIVAALRPEKNHSLFLRMAERVLTEVPETHFLIVGDGDEAPKLRAETNQRRLTSHVHFLGTRSDIPRILAALNVFCLTSHNEANPVSILESLSVRVPVVATDVGSVSTTVQPNQTGFLVEPENDAQFAARVLQILHDPALAHRLGTEGREQVEKHWSLERMVRGYEQLIVDLYYRKRSGPRGPQAIRNAEGVEICGAS
jgi:glycosyltransferase involved in cell wall biosynthesis